MQNRRRFIKNIALGTAGIGLLSSFDLLERIASKDIIRLTVLHTNDMHSHVDPFEANDRHYPNQGGMSRIATLIKDIRKDEGEILLLDAGDIFQGTPYFNLFKGEVEFKLMSEMGYDAATMGNHDFDIGLDGFNKVLPNANFPFLCSNYDFSNTLLKDKTSPYKVISKKGLKIGIFGIGIELDGLVDSKLYQDTIFIDPIAKANETAKVLKHDLNCNAVICLSHLGYEYANDKLSDQILAKETENIDLIIGGHTHTFLEKAETFYNKIGKPVAVNQAGWAGLRLGRVDLFFDKKGSQLSNMDARVFTSKNYAKF